MGHAYYGAYVISVICEGSEFADEFVDGLYHVIVVCCIAMIRLEQSEIQKYDRGRYRIELYSKIK